MTKQRDFLTDWLPCVDAALRAIGYKHKALCPNSWRQLYEEGLSPFAAINESEFDGNITYKQFRHIQLQFQAKGE